MLRTCTALRTLVPALVVLAALGAAAHAFVDTHLNEITEPLGSYAQSRVTEIDGLPSVDKATKKERKLLAKLASKTSRDVADLKGDFKELLLGGKTAKKLKDAVTPMRDALDESFARAELALGERREFVNDHVLLITDATTLKKVQKKLDAYNRARGDAAAAADDLARAKALAKAEKGVTSALKLAEKGAQRAVNESTSGLKMPLVRLRSGDTVGSGGARVAIPIDADSDIAGAAVDIPPGALASPRAITLEPADSFVGGRDTAAGPAVRVLPAGIQLNQPVRVHVPYALPQDGSLADLALFHRTGDDITATLDIDLGLNGTLSGQATSFSEFQAGLLAPPLGAPSGKYHVEMLFVSHTLSADGSTPSEEAIGVAGQDWTFRADHTGRRDAGSAPLVFRAFTAESPFHVDGYSPGLVGSVDYAWEQLEEGRFRFSFPGTLGATAHAEGVVSQTGDVIAFTGHGGAFDFLAVGVRDGVQATNADMQGRWLAVELGAQLIGPDQSPFVSRYVSSYTWFQADAPTKTLTFSGSGTAFLTDRQFDPGTAGHHAVSTSSQADGGTEDFNVLPNGQVQGDSLRRLGWVHPGAGIFVSVHGDSSARSVELMIAVKQPATLPAAIFRGDYRLARMDWTARRDSPDTFRSFLDIDQGVGRMSVAELGEATVAMEGVERTAYALHAMPSTGAVDWRSSSVTSDVTPANAVFLLSLDAAANHVAGTAPRWYGVSGDGQIVLGATQATGPVRGIAIGLR